MREISIIRIVKGQGPRADPKVIAKLQYWLMLFAKFQYIGIISSRVFSKKFKHFLGKKSVSMEKNCLFLDSSDISQTIIIIVVVIVITRGPGLFHKRLLQNNLPHSVIGRLQLQYLRVTLLLLPFPINFLNMGVVCSSTSISQKCTIL